MDHDDVLRGGNVTLAPLRLEHVTRAYVSWLNDPEVVAGTEVLAGGHTIRSVRAYVRAALAAPDAKMWQVLAEDELHVGNIRLSRIDLRHQRATVALLIGNKAHWGRGLGSEAIRLVSEHALGAMGLHKLTAGIYADNPASLRAFEKAGFVVEAVLREHVRSRGRFVDVLQLARFDRCTAAPEAQ